MTSRPRITPKSRPLSAIFLGSSGSTPPALPDLPEPPSPSTSSTASGLPSPPATNSTGSGSVDEGRSFDAGSVRRRAGRSHSSATMPSDLGEKILLGYARKHGAGADDEEGGDDNENDEDNTARLQLGDRRRSYKAAPDNAAALERVKSLTQRNRMVLDKLSSISRNSPVPSNHSSRSPLSPPLVSSSSSSVSSSRRSSGQGRPSSVTTSSTTSSSSNGRRREQQQSGSETEREGQALSVEGYSSSSEGRPSTPPAPLPEFRGVSSVRQRRISAPASPGKLGVGSRDRDRAISPGPSRTFRKRVSMALSIDETHRDGSDDDVTAAALAAVASSRRSPPGKKGRQPLPKEFRERKSSDERPVEPQTPHRHPGFNEVGRASPSPRTTRISMSGPPGSPRRPPASMRLTNVREMARKHQTRWMSEDFTGREEDALDTSPTNTPRRQGHRAGSSEGMMANGRSVVTEGLRAAGLTKRRDDDVFSNSGSMQPPPSPRRTRSSGNQSAIISSDEPKTPFPTVSKRPGTSMAAFQLGNRDGHAPLSLRSYKSTYALDRERLQDPSAHERASTASPFATLRSATAQSNALRENNAEHRRLMLESLSVFESHLSRLPPMGQTTTSTIPEVFQNAQQLVHALDRLNAMLKEGTNRALEAQIEAEVADQKPSVDLVDIWRQVGAEHRENMRVSDEIVRNMTGFLLGVGKILREATSPAGQQHLRALSLDQEVVRRGTPEVPLSAGHISDGRRSREARRSWEPSAGDQVEYLARLPSRERTTSSRPSSSMNMLRSSAGSSSEGRSVAGHAPEPTPPSLRNGSGTLGVSASRRLYSPRGEQGEPISLVTSFDSQNTSAEYEPSPTPLTRTSNVVFPERRSTAVPPALSTVPSESFIARSNTTTESSGRRKISSSSINTIRAEPPPFTPVIKPSNPTTAVTPHTVTHTPHATVHTPITGPTAYPLLRNESGSSSRSSNNATISRANGLHQHDRALTSGPPVESPLSSSESESDRGSRFRTLASRPRASLDGNRSGDSPIEASASTVSYSAARKERRRTITEIFSQR